jgi:hypothetical protein
MGKDGWLLRGVLTAHKRPVSQLVRRLGQQYVQAMADSRNTETPDSEKPGAEAPAL